MAIKGRRMGLSNDVLEVIRRTCSRGEIFTSASFEIEGCTQQQISHTLSGLKAKGLIHGGPMKGQYYWKPTNGKDTSDPEQVVIENLLDAMAKAEPILKKWQKVHHALQGL